MWGIAYDDTPGVSSFCGAAAALNAEYTLPGVSQTVITHGWRPAPSCRGRTLDCAGGPRCHNGDLSLNRLIDKVQAALLQGAYTAATPAAVVYKATWPEEKNSALYCWHAGRADAGGRHYQDGAHRGGGFPRCAV